MPQQHNRAMSPKDTACLEAELVALLAERATVDARRRALTARAIAVREELRAARTGEKLRVMSPNEPKRTGAQRLDEVARLLGAGNTAAQIADELGISLARAKKLVTESRRVRR
jgi:DNA-binding NarL/FixJ family response regulator